MQWADLEQQLINRGLVPNQARELIWEAISSALITIARAAPMVENQLLEGDVPYENILASVRKAIGSGLIITLPAAVSEDNTSPTLLAFAQIIAAAREKLYLIWDGS